MFSCALYSTESNPLLSLPHLKLHSCLKRVKGCPGFDSSLHLRRGQDEWLSSALRWETKGTPHCCPQLLHSSENQQQLCSSLLPGRGKFQAPESLSVTEGKGGAAGEDSSHRHGQEGWLLPGTGEMGQGGAGSDPRPFVLVLVSQPLVFWASLDVCSLPSDSKNRFSQMWEIIKKFYPKG